MTVIGKDDFGAREFRLYLLATMRAAAAVDAALQALGPDRPQAHAARQYCREG